MSAELTLKSERGLALQTSIPKLRRPKTFSFGRQAQAATGWESPVAVAPLFPWVQVGWSETYEPYLTASLRPKPTGVSISRADPA